MFIPVIYPSAAEFWLNVENLSFTNRLTPFERTIVTLPGQYSLCHNKEDLFLVQKKLALSFPVSILAPNGSERRNNQFFKYESYPVGFPSTGFVNMGKLNVISAFGEKQLCRILVASPELCFLQAAKCMTLIELIKFGYDLCAMYLFDETAEYKQKNRNIITSAKDIRTFIESASNTRGVVKARQAIRHVNDRSNSPMETELSMIAGLPFIRGGFGLQEQELNKEVRLSKEGAAILGRKSCLCDIVWEKQKLVVEYDSNLVHLKTEQHDWDKRKTAALNASGYRIFPITSKMVSDVAEIEKTFLTLRKMLGKRTHAEDIIRTREKRKELLCILKNINGAKGNAETDRRNAVKYC